MTTLINAAKKHQTEVRYCVKNIAVTRQDKNINMPKRYVLLILETKRGVIVTIRYIIKAIMAKESGKSVLFTESFLIKMRSQS